MIRISTLRRWSDKIHHIREQSINPGAVPAWGAKSLCGSTFVSADASGQGSRMDSIYVDSITELEHRKGICPECLNKLCRK